jgi:hypothetical protein
VEGALNGISHMLRRHLKTDILKQVPLNLAGQTLQEDVVQYHIKTKINHAIQCGKPQ